ncbi:MAG TPA: DUF3052 domain-containing protein [Candidatus Kapabacteria bacterium]|nr:DUF3052 domain-containing protein [Candidatus Kapabacteria bacterium]
MAGYSGTPLVKKLGIKAGMKISVVGAPEEFWKELGEMPEVKATEKPTKEMDFILFFSDSKKMFEKHFSKFRDALSTSGMLWISWPKKASKIATDLNENIIRNFGLANGLVDVKVCAVTDKWSGLKFVYRLKDRV